MDKTLLVQGNVLWLMFCVFQVVQFRINSRLFLSAILCDLHVTSLVSTLPVSTQYPRHRDTMSVYLWHSLSLVAVNTRWQ